MILPIATLLAYSIAMPSAITEPPRPDPAKRAKIHATAKEEHAKTLSLRADWKHRRHILFVEREAKRAVEEAPAPPPLPMGPSTGLSAAVYNHIVVGGGMPMGGNPTGQVGIPQGAGQLPPMYTYVYGPLIRRFADSGM